MVQIDACLIIEPYRVREGKPRGPRVSTRNDVLDHINATNATMHQPGTQSPWRMALRKTTR
jgi:hypothetical protein